MTAPCDWSALELIATIERGDLTAADVVQSCLDRIAEREPGVGAWQYLDPQRALDAALRIDQAPTPLLLRGIPFGVKDIIETADMPTEYGSPIYRSNRVRWDAACVALARQAGGILIGKTVTTEFAHRHPGKTRNPHNVAHTPGGSSSGSAAAVAAGMVPFALGTQTGGSTIRPASFCGVVGYKPTFGDFSLFGVREQTRSFDTLSVFAREIDDIGLVRAVLLRDRWEPLASVPLSSLRIAFCRTPYWPEAEDSTRALLEDGVQALRSSGARVTDMPLPAIFDRVGEAARWVSGFEFARCMTHELVNHGEQLSRVLREGRAADGLNCTYERYAEALGIIAEGRAVLAALLQKCDVVLAPSAPGEAPEGIASSGNPIFNRLWNDMHVPALNVPAFTGPKGLPVGIQLIGKWHKDRDLLQIAKAIRPLLSRG